MRKFFLSFLILFSFAVKGQDTCTNDARNYVNTNIIRNGVRLITAPMMNVALNKIINAIECVDGGVFVSTDSNTVVNYDVLNSQNAPPGSPATGDIYLVGNSPSGAWVGHAKDIAEWDGADWVFTDGVQGDFLYNATTALTYIFRSGNWVQTTGIPALNNGNTISSGLKIGTNNLKSLTFETNNKSVSRFDSIGRFYVYDTALRKSNKFLQIDSSTGRLIASAISANSGSSTLFPNGVKLVLSSRDFQADDKDYVLLCPVPGTIITMPTTNPFSEGDYVGVVMSSPDSYFETYNNGVGGTDKMYPYTQNLSGTTLEQQSSSEVVILRALNQGTLWILPLCGAVKTSNDINGSNYKTLSRYNYDQSQNVTDSQSLSLAFSDSIRMSISRGNTISFAYAYDSVSTNTAGDSMITFKAGVRRAYEIVSGSSGSTFNGLKLVTTSRDLDSTDVGYVLVLFTDSLELTMPEIAPFKDNDNIAIASFADNCSVVTTFGTPELYLLGFAENRTQTIQMQYSAENGGFLLLNSGFIFDTGDSNKLKTTELYYYEKIKKSPIKGTFSEPSAVAQTDFVVTIPTQIDTTYEVTIQGKNPLSAVLYYVADADKTTTSFTVKTGAGLTGAVEFGYILKP